MHIAAADDMSAAVLDALKNPKKSMQFLRENLPSRAIYAIMGRSGL